MDLFQKCHDFTRAKELQAIGMYPYFIPIHGSEGTEIEVGGRRLIMAGSNNYLGLTHHPHVIEQSARAVELYGSSCTGSRLLNGTLELHEQLEGRLASFLGREKACCFSTGFQSNLGAISALCGKNDVILCDRENHASIVDGCRLSFAELRKFRHNDIEDLRRQLELIDRPGARGKLIIVDGVFSMMGDLAKLPEIAAVAKEHDARLLVDEAHSIGVLGEHGRGAAELLGVEDDVDLIVGTFSKSFASIGGFIAGPEPVIHFIKHHARSLLFSASIPPAAAAAALAALEVMEAEPELRTKLLANADRVRRELDGMGFEVGRTESPIVPVVIGEQERAFAFWRTLFDTGLFTNPVTPPAVPMGMDLIRTSYMATHTTPQLDRIVEIFARVGEQFEMVARNAG